STPESFSPQPTLPSISVSPAHGTPMAPCLPESTHRSLPYPGVQEPARVGVPPASGARQESPPPAFRKVPAYARALVWIVLGGGGFLLYRAAHSVPIADRAAVSGASHGTPPAPVHPVLTGFTLPQTALQQASQEAQERRRSVQAQRLAES